MPIFNQPGGGSVPSAATVRMSSSPTVNVGDVLPFDTALIDTDGYFDPITHLFTIPTGKGGGFLVGAEVGTGTPGAATHLEVAVQNSGNDHNVSSAMPPPFGLNVCASSLLQLADGDTLQCVLIFDGGGTMQAFSSQSEFWLVKVT